MVNFLSDTVLYRSPYCPTIMRRLLRLMYKQCVNGTQRSTVYAPWF